MDPLLPGDNGATDEELLLAIARDADRSAFAALFRRFAGRLKGFLIKGGAQDDVAEEIAQDVMVTVWRKAKSFDPTKAGAATWIFTIARNRRIDHLRRAGRPEPTADDPAFVPEPEPTPERVMEGEDRDKRVRDALARLTKDQREVVQLAFYGGLSHGEIAAHLQAPLGTVKSRLRLSFAHLRGELGTGFVQELVDE